MKKINIFLKESLFINEASYDLYDKIYEKISNIDKFIKTPIFKDKIKEATLLTFNKTTGELINKEILSNKPEEKFPFWNHDSYVYVYIEDGSINYGVSVVTNTKKGGIKILVANESNIDIVINFVKDNLEMFDFSSSALSKEDIDILTNFFKENVKHFGVKTDKGTFAIYFPDRETLKNKVKYIWNGTPIPDRMGVNNIPHLTVSKPHRLKGGYGVTLYKKGRWSASEYPNPKRAFNSDGTPKYGSISDVIALINKNFIDGDWYYDLGAEKILK